MTFGDHRSSGNPDASGTTNFFNVKAYGALARNFVASITKGDRVIVIGMIRTETWSPQDGDPDRSRQIVVADETGPSTHCTTAWPEQVSARIEADDTEVPFKLPKPFKRSRRVHMDPAVDVRGDSAVWSLKR